MAKAKTTSPRTPRSTTARTRPSRGPTRRHRRSTSGWILPAVVAAAIVVAIVWFTRPDGPGTTSAAAPFTGGDLHSVATVPGSGVLFVGGHEAVSTSTDGGSTWSNIESLESADAMGWAFLDGAIWMGGHPGLRVSTDGGRTFEQRNDGLPATDIHALGGTGSTLYAASPAAGFLVSVDGGSTWEVRNPGVGQSFMGSMLVDPNDPDRIVAPDMSAGAVETTDGGRTWRALGGVPAMWVSWDPGDTDLMIVTGTGVAAISRDGGKSWEQLPVPDGTSVVQIDANDPTTWYAAAWSEDGTVEVSTSTDGGSSWTPG